MKLLIKLAWRNIWRNKRRSILTIIAISFATLAAIAMRGLQLGTYEENIKNAVEQFTGYIQIQHKEYKNEPSLNKTVRLTDELKSYLDNNEKVKGYGKRVYADGLISYKDNSFGSAVFGIDPNEEEKITDIINRTDEGKFFLSDTSDKIVIGYKLLQNLNAEIGDTVVILAQGFDGTLGNLKFEIAGTIKMGSYEFDAMAVFMGLKTAQYLLAMHGRINVVAVSLYSIDDINSVQKELTGIIDTEKAAVLKWNEVMPELEQFIAIDNISGLFFLAILVIIVAFGILNTILMSVTERFREFGITLAIGMQQFKLVYIVLIETVFLTLVGIIIGNIIGFGINYYIVQNPIVFTSELGALYEEYGFLPIIKSTLDPLIFIYVTMGVLIVSLIAGIYPLYKTYKLEPLKGIRYT